MSCRIRHENLSRMTGRLRLSTGRGLFDPAARRLVLATTLVLNLMNAGCHRKLQVVGTDGTVASAPVPAVPRAVASRRVISQTTDGGPAAQQSLNDYRRALSVGRRQTRAKEYALADAAFSNALDVRAKDPRAFAERGYARMLAGRLDAAEKDLTDALGSTDDRRLRAQVYYNLALVRQRRKDPRATALFATAKTLSLSGEGRDAGDGPACRVEIILGEGLVEESDRERGISVAADTSYLSDNDAFVVDDFVEAARHLYPGEETVTDAKARVCRRLVGQDDEHAEGENVCDAAPPWVLYPRPMNSFTFEFEEWILAPRTKGVGYILYSPGITSGSLRNCRNDSFTVPTIHGDVLELDRGFGGENSALPEEPDAGNEFGCLDLPAGARKKFVHLTDGETLLTLLALDSDPWPRVAFGGEGVSISGENCDRKFKWKSTGDR